MSKKYKVKHYYGKNSISFRAKPRVLTILFALLLFAGFGYLGTVIYAPVSEFIMNLGKEPPPIEEILPESESEPESEPEPEPEEPEKTEFKELRALYVPIPQGGGEPDIDAVLSEIEGSGINAVMIDIKNPAGEVLFKTKNEMANKWGVVTQNAVDLRELAGKLEAKGITLAAKMSVFRDPKAASAGRIGYAINYQNSEMLWLDNSPENGGKPWLNPYSLSTQDYISSLAGEAFDAGVKFLALENLQFPDNSAVYATFGKDSATMSRAEILQATVANLEKIAEEKGARVAVTFSVTDVTRTNGEETRYGGSILKTAGKYLLLDVSPSQFEGAFSQNGLEITNAETDPAEAIKTAINYIKPGISPEAMIIPMLANADDGQTAAVKTLGYEEYFLRSIKK